MWRDAGMSVPGSHGDEAFNDKFTAVRGKIEFTSQSL
jgi:hypothetical protein